MKIPLAILLTILLSACSLLPGRPADTPTEQEAAQSTEPGMMNASESGTGEGMGVGPGMGPGMMGRHHATIPAEYAQKSSPFEADAASIERGQAIYNLHCTTCHGESGMGDGPAGVSLDPPASPIAHTSQMLADDYIFWRVSEGGIPFKTAMPAWKEILDEDQRWDVLNYVRALGRDGAAAIATAQAERQAEMLKQAVEQGVISQAEAEAFRTVHDLLEEYMKQQGETQAGMDEREAAALQALIQDGKISEQQAEQFHIAHDKLAEAGLMP